VSRYFDGSNSVDSVSISALAISISRSFVSASAAAPSSSKPSRSTTSSANSIVSIVSTSPVGRIATRLSFWRMTTLAIATLPASSIAVTSSLYAFAAPLSGSR
jgi:hypothetical protein